ncbi:MAG: LamG domain-containing protein [Spirochaetaceae bacterium]
MKTLSILILFLVGGLLSADTLYLSNNNVVKGKIIELSDTVVKIETSNGVLEVEKTRIVRGEFFGEGSELSGELVFEFLLDGKIKDTSGSGYPIVTKSIPYTEGVLNDEKAALESSGDGQYFYIEDSSSISEVDNFTIALNFYPVDTTKYRYLISNWENTLKGGKANGRFTLAVKGKNLVYNVVDSSGYHQALAVNDVLNLKQWNSIAMRFNSGEMSLYVNGETVGKNVIPLTTLLKGSWPLYFLTYKFGLDFTTYNIVGKIDNIKMYNAFLSDSELNLLYKIENM